MKIIKIFRISRPRFWMYLFGPYLLGILAANTAAFLNWKIILWGVFFLFPANLFVYGVNDIFDYETDKFNPKKNEYEEKIEKNEYKKLVIWILFLVLPFLLFLPFSSLQTVFSLGIFIFLSFFYSAPPLRAKTKPFFDSLFNALYFLPGIFGYLLAGGKDLDWKIVIAALLWCMAMHAYSAVPDIEADSKAGLRTIATWLGFHKTLLLCGVLYFFAAVFSFSALGFYSYFFGLVYIFLMYLSFLKKENHILSLYKIFPLVNTYVGFLLFLFLVLE